MSDLLAHTLFVADRGAEMHVPDGAERVDPTRLPRVAAGRLVVVLEPERVGPPALEDARMIAAATWPPARPPAGGYDTVLALPVPPLRAALQRRPRRALERIEIAAADERLRVHALRALGPHARAVDLASLSALEPPGDAPPDMLLVLGGGLLGAAVALRFLSQGTLLVSDTAFAAGLPLERNDDFLYGESPEEALSLAILAQRSIARFFGVRVRAWQKVGECFSAEREFHRLLADLERASQPGRAHGSP